MAQPIENHGIVGNLRTAALIGLDGALSFLCWPRFDSPSIFASLLDDERGGSFELTPVLDGARHRQLYLPDTNVLLTRFLSSDGVAEISDFMSIGDLDAGSRLVRRVKAVRGSIHFRMRCMPRFDYARLDPKIYEEAGTVIFRGGHLALRLRASVPVDVSKGVAQAEFDLAAGESASFILEDASYGEDSISADPGYVSAAFTCAIGGAASATNRNDQPARDRLRLQRWRGLAGTALPCPRKDAGGRAPAHRRCSRRHVDGPPRTVAA